MIFVALLILSVDVTEADHTNCTSGMDEEHLSGNSSKTILPLSTTLRGKITLEIMPADMNFSVYFFTMNGTRSGNKETGAGNFNLLLGLYTIPGRFVIVSKDGEFPTVLYLDPDQEVPTFARIQISDK